MNAADQRAKSAYLRALLDNVALPSTDLERRNRAAIASFLMRCSLYLRGRQFPDPRDQEGLDRYAEIEWRRAVARHRLPPGRMLNILDRIPKFPMFLRRQAD